MSRAKGVVFAAALGMIAATAWGLSQMRHWLILGPPGVNVGAVPIYDEYTNVVATNGVLLPATVLGIPSQPGAISADELTGLPKDTTFGRRLYRQDKDSSQIQLSVVLMGTDHTSIHQPQYCLFAQGWRITNSERITIRMDGPHPYEIPAIKLTATLQPKNSARTVNCLYVYWFVSGNRVTAEEGSRLFSMWKNVVQKGEIERWAYISYFQACAPGTESSTFQRLEDFIRASAPEFQLVTGGAK